MSEKKTVNVTSHNQSGGITAGEVNIYGSKPARHLTTQDLEHFRRIPAGANVTVVAPIGDAEAIGFADEIAGWLRTNGWPGVMNQDVMRYPPMVGQKVIVNGNEVQILIGANQ
jgi:hypothetical protein